MDLGDVPKDVRKLLDEAHRNTQPRKHHIVPASYLERWSVDGTVRVHVLDESRSYVTRPGKAARQTDYYRAESDDIDPGIVPPMIFETILSRIEGSAVGAIDELIGNSGRISAQVRYDLATFMAFQNARGHRQRLRVRTMAHIYAKLMTEGISDEQIRERLAEVDAEVREDDIEKARKAIEQLQNDELLVVPQDVQATSMAFSAAELAAALLFTRPWMIGKTPKSLITTDEPVLPIPGPGSAREEAGGVGHAGLVVFPLSPDRILIAVRPDLADHLGLPQDLNLVETVDLDFAETFALCRELLMGATRWAFERSDRKVVTKFPIPERPEDVSLDEFMSTSGDESSLIRFYSYNRWANADYVPVWPLERFWPPEWRAWPLPPGLADHFEEIRRDAEKRFRSL